MRKIAWAAFFAACVFSAAMAAGWKWGNGELVASTRDVGAFTAIEVSGAATLVVTPGEGHSCVVRTDSNLQDEFMAEVKGKTLILGFRKGSAIGKVTKLEVALSMKELSSLKASGASNVTLKPGFSGRELMLKFSGASVLEAVVDYPVIGLRADGASTLNLGGRGSQLALDLSGATRMKLSMKLSGLSGSVSGASRIAAEDSSLDEVDLKLSGASSAELGQVATKMKLRLSGASRLAYAGDPVIEKKLDAASSVRRR